MAAGRITGEKQFLIIGNQSLHGKFHDLPDDISRSAEVELIAQEEIDRKEWLNVIGQDSPFHETYGYYADPVDETTAGLPDGWIERLVNLELGETAADRTSINDTIVIVGDLIVFSIRIFGYRRFLAVAVMTVTFGSIFIHRGSDYSSFSVYIQ